MKITSKQLGKVILEEIDNTLKEIEAATSPEQLHKSKQANSDRAFREILNMLTGYAGLIERRKEAGWKEIINPVSGRRSMAKRKGLKSKRQVAKIDAQLSQLGSKIAAATSVWEKEHGYSSDYVVRGQDIIQDLLDPVAKHPEGIFAGPPGGENKRNLVALKSHADSLERARFAAT